MLISVIGAPGSGKGTLLTLLSNEFPSIFSHFSLGDHLRQLLLQSTHQQQHRQQQQQQQKALLKPHVREQIQRSELLSLKDLLPILKEGLREKGFLLREKGQGKDNEKERKEKILLLDGFPRDISQIKLSGMSDDDDEKEEGLEFLQPDLVLFFDCPGEIAQRRYLARGIPGRDVDVRIFERRFEEFERLNGEVVEEFGKRGILVRIDTSQDTETSYRRLLRALRDSGFGLCKEGGGLEKGGGKETE